MNKQDWLEYFEAVNGREATEADIEQAQLAGEFEAEVVAEPSTVQEIAEESVVETMVVQAPAEKQVATGNTQNTPQSQTDGASQFKAASSNFWNWLVDAWKNPTKEDDSQYNGLITLGITAALLGITVYTLANKLVNSISSAFGQSSSSNADLSVFLIGFVTFALFLFSLTLSSFISRRFIYQDESYTFMKSFAWFGRATALTAPLSLLIFLLVLMGSFQLAGFLLAVFFLLVGTALTYSLLPVGNKTQFDNYYRFLIAVVLSGVIVGIFFRIEYSILGNYIRQTPLGDLSQFFNPMSL